MTKFGHKPYDIVRAKNEEKDIAILKPRFKAPLLPDAVPDTAGDAIQAENAQLKAENAQLKAKLAALERRA